VVSRDLESDDVRIPRGSTIPVVRTDGDERTILLPDGTTLTVSAAAVTMCDTTDDTVARIEAALDLLYVPYVFGGCSPLGLDCSGMVANVSARSGSKPSRDAWQQALSGWLVATPWHRTNIRAGDQLFFMNQSGKISHTGVALDAQHFIHSAPPCVQIASFDPEDPLYDAYRTRTFFIAKRP
jgi:cell wall-associated NlpC family hydrolase